MRRSERRNNLQICPRQDSNTGGSDLWSNTLPLDHGGAPPTLVCQHQSRSGINYTLYIINNIDFTQIRFILHLRIHALTHMHAHACVQGWDHTKNAHDCDMWFSTYFLLFQARARARTPARTHITWLPTVTKNIKRNVTSILDRIIPETIGETVIESLIKIHPPPRK